MNKNNLSKVLLTFVAILFATSSFAIPKEPCESKEEVCCEDPAPGPFAFSYPRDMGLACPRDFFAYGEFLWMKGIQEGLDYAVEQDTVGSVFPLTAGKLKGFSTQSQEWDWKPGFRLGLGFYTNYDNFSFEFDLTYIRMKAWSTSSNDGNGILMPLFLPPLASNMTIPLAAATWDGDFYTFDFMMGKPYHVSRYYVSSPKFGLRAAWIDQNYHVRYFYLSENNVNVENDYWGVGLTTSYEGQFLLGSGWYIYGKALVSLLYGNTTVDQKSDVGTVDAGVLANYVYYENSYNIKPAAEVEMGFSWGKYFNKGQYLASLKLGYQFQQWWNQFQARKFFDVNPASNDTISRRDLSFNGLVLGIGLDF